MKHKRQCLAAVALTGFAFTAFGFGGGDGNTYDMDWFTIDGGGGYSFNGDFELHGTIGQHDAGPALSGGEFSLAGGFWAGDPVPGSEIATLFDFQMLYGSLLTGGLAELVDSDDAYLQTRSRPGLSVLDRFNMELRVLATTTISNPATIDLTLEAHVDQPAGTVEVRAFNYNTAQYDFIGDYAIGMSDNVQQYFGLDAAQYVSNLGEIDVNLKHIVLAGFFSFSFESFLDQVEIVVNE